MVLFFGIFSLSLPFEVGAQESSKESIPLFSGQDRELLNYLKSSQFLIDKSTVDIVKGSRQRMKVALKVYAAADRKQRQQFFKGDIWEREEQRENYFALQRLLQEVSPITKPKERK